MAGKVLLKALERSEVKSEFCEKRANMKSSVNLYSQRASAVFRGLAQKIM